jgi:hypothetical protein
MVAHNKHTGQIASKRIVWAARWFIIEYIPPSSDPNIIREILYIPSFVEVPRLHRL